MSAKDNFAQAMKELLNGGEGEGASEMEEKKAAPSSFSSFSQPDSRPARAPAPEPREERTTASVFGNSSFSSPPPEMNVQPMATQPPPAPAPAPMQQEHRSASVFGAASQPAPAMQQPVYQQPTSMVGNLPTPMPTPVLATGEATVVAPGTTIVGDITTAAGLRVGGDVKGNLKVASLMELNGKVIGDIEAADAVIIGSVVRGNVSVSNVLTMDGDSTVVGDVSAKSVDINGKIKGNLTVEERGHFQNEAVLVGNLMSGTVIIDEGAMLKGDISITSAQTETVTVDEPDFDIG